MSDKYLDILKSILLTDVSTMMGDTCENFDK